MDAEQRKGIKTRAVAPKVVSHYRDRLADMQGDIETLLKDEEQEKEMRVAQMHLDRASNVLQHDDEIAARPQRLWFQSGQMKEEAREKAKAEVAMLDKRQAQAIADRARGYVQDVVSGKKAFSAPVDPEERLKQAKKSQKKGEGGGGGKLDVTHRLTRKKRRRLESMAMLNEAAVEDEYSDDSEGDEGAEKKRRAPTAGEKQKAMARRETGQVMSARHAKRSAKLKKIAENEDPDAAVAGAGGGSDFDDDEFGGSSRSRGARAAKKRATVVATEDGFDGNDEDGGEGGSGNSGRRNAGHDGDGKKRAAGPMGFTEFDPNRLGLRKKKNAPRAGSFSSKSKYKRRK